GALAAAHPVARPDGRLRRRGGDGPAGDRAPGQPGALGFGRGTGGARRGDRGRQPPRRARRSGAAAGAGSRPQPGRCRLPGDGVACRSVGWGLRCGTVALDEPLSGNLPARLTATAGGPQGEEALRTLLDETTQQALTLLPAG